MMTQLTVQDLGTILGVWAHPDDEIFTCAGIMAAAVENGQQVVCVTATKGEMGVQDPDRWPPDRLADIRTRELHDSYEVLGVSEHHWLGYSDGACSQIDAKQAQQKIRHLVERYSPDTILSFGPEGMTGHPDHQMVSSWATAVAHEQGIRMLHAVLTPHMFEATREADKMFDMFFNIDTPPVVPEAQCTLVVTLEGELLQKKCDAMIAMPSQTERLIEFLGHDRLCAMSQEEAFVEAA